MARNDGRIEKGQKLSTAISARAWNRAQLAADVVLGSITGTSADVVSSQHWPHVWVYYKNTTDQTIGQRSVLNIDGITPALPNTEGPQVRQFFRKPCVLATLRKTVGGDGLLSSVAWCVAIDSTKPGTIGKAAVGGVGVVNTADLVYATGCSVLWKNTVYALVCIEQKTCIGSIDFDWSDVSQTKPVKLGSNLFLNAANGIGPISCSQQTACTLTCHQGEWYVTAIDISGFSNFPGTSPGGAPKVLGKLDGKIQWLNLRSASVPDADKFSKGSVVW
jgi:hypothetical protein